MSRSRNVDPLILYSQANQPKTKTIRKKRNAAPEKLVEKQVMEWLAWHDFDMNVVESKAVFNAKAGRYLNSQATPGVSDLFGNNKYGRGVFIELKSPGKIRNVSEAQMNFLERKINTNCFAIVTDSVERLEKLYTKWKSMVNISSEEARMFLLSQLKGEPSHGKGNEKSEV